MTHDELEFLISQHYDGTLSAAESGKLRARLESDPSARRQFEDHGKMDSALKSTRASLDIDQDWLTAEIAGAIDEAESRRITPVRRRLYSVMVLAASLLIGVTLAVVFLQDTGTTSPGAASPQVVAGRVEIGPVDSGTATPVASVSVGIPGNVTPALMTALYVPNSQSRGKVIIQPAGELAQGPFD